MATTRCIPNNSASGGVNWLNSVAGTQLLKDIDDAWWIGSLRDHLGGSGSAPHVVFQSVLGTDGGGQYVDLSWNVKLDPDPVIDTILDAVVVCFTLSTGQPVVIKITPNGSSLINSGGAASFTSTMLRRSGSDWVAATEPAWIGTNTRIWVKPGAAAPVTPNSQWAVQMRVPNRSEAAGGLPLANPFSMWYCVHVSHAMGANLYSMPATLGVVEPASDTYPAPTQGLLYSLNTAAAGFTCGSNVTLAYNDVGTNNRDAGGNATPHIIKTATENEFFIRPKNETGALIAAGRIKVTLRLANWGAASSLGPWRPLTPNPGNPGSDHGAIANNNNGTITVNWTPTASESATYLTTPHQCIMVEMRDTTPPGLNFIPRQLMRNMDFAKGSTFRREAEINIQGTPAMKNAIVPPPRRDTYLYVERLNLPEKYRGQEPDIILKRGTADGPTPGQQIPDILLEHRRQESPLFRLFDLLNYDDFEYYDWEPIAAFLPTYRVHAFYDTGERFTRNGQVFPVLESLSTFGYYLDHDGPITGWDTRLQGAEKLDENWYILRVPQNGSAKVTTVVRAIDPSKPEEPLPAEPIVPRPTYKPTTPELPVGCREVLLALWRFLSALLKPLLDQINRKP
jgi:hypothetical protein